MNSTSFVKVSVIIVTYNSRNEVGDCLNSLRREASPMEVFLVDNASEDGTREMLKQISSSGLKVILNDRNLGLAQANNQPMTMSAGEYVLILNPDAIIKKGAIDAMCAYLDGHKDVGVVGPRIYSRDGSIERSFATKWRLIPSLFWHLPKVPFEIEQRRSPVSASTQPKDVLFVSGACLMIRRELYSDLGGFDPNFFLALEDVVDLCMRVGGEGYRVVYYPGAEVSHLQGRAHKGFLSIFWTYHGHLYFQTKYSGRSASLLLRVGLLIDALVEVGIMGAGKVLRKRRDRRFLLAYAFVAGRLLTRSTRSLYEEGLHLAAILSSPKPSETKPW